MGVGGTFRIGAIHCSSRPYPIAMVAFLTLYQGNSDIIGPHDSRRNLEIEKI